MAEESRGSGSIRFGPFELSLETHELSRDGIRLRLHGQPIQVLELLVACPGTLVTRDELKKKLWPKETFGDFERGLNAAVNRLRDKLGDSAVEPIYIETVPGRGYRFIGKIEKPPEVPDTPPKPVPDETKRRALALALIVAMAAIAVAAYLLWPRVSPHSSVLIGDLDSRGDDPLPEGGIREGLTVALQQSKYVNVFSRLQVQEVLAQMEKAPDTRVDEATGREICQRANLQVLLTGTIENLGKVFEVTLRAVDPGKGSVFFAEREQFKKEEVFEKIDALAKLVRKDLGESRKGINANSRPLAEVTTHDLQALQLYSQAADARDQGRVEQVPALLHAALSRDPEFAMAHWLIADVYEIIGNRAQELQHLKLAFEHRNRLTDRESRFIEASYYIATQRTDEAVNVLTALVALYPRDPEGHNSLAFAYYNIADLDNSIKELKEVIKIDPHSAPAYGQLMVWLARNNAPEEALNVYHKAQVQGVAPPVTEWGLGMAFWNQGNVAEAQAHFQRLQARGSLYASIGRIYFARTLIYQGKLAAAGAQLAAGILEGQAASNKAPELLERYLLAAVALTQGNQAEARRQLQLMLTAGGPSALEAVDLQRAGALYARMRDLASARRVLRRLEDLLTNMPSRSNSAYRDSLAGEIALAEGRNADAERLFSASLIAYPLALSHQGLARAHEVQQDWPMASKEWETFLNSRGEIFQDDCPTDWVLAHLFIARVRRHLIDIDGSKAEYKRFLELWRDCDYSQSIQEFVREAQQATEGLGPPPRALGRRADEH